MHRERKIIAVFVSKEVLSETKGEGGGKLPPELSISNHDGSFYLPQTHGMDTSTFRSHHINHTPAKRAETRKHGCPNHHANIGRIRMGLNK
jgi:hypothetical protein